MNKLRMGCLLGLSILCSAQLNAQVSITIDTTAVQQTMQGFGTSLRVFNDPHIIGGSTLDPITDGLVISTAEEDVIMDLLYTDLGLTRVRPANGEDGAIEDPNDNNDPDSTDLSQFDFSWKRMDAHIDLVARMVPRGVDTYFPSAIKIEDWMTVANPEEYAEWAFAIIERWRNMGYELPYYSIINEPGYVRGGIWPGTYLRDCIKFLGPKMDAAGINTRIVIPDDLNATQAIGRAQVIMADSVARSYVGALAYHLYGGIAADRTAMAQLGQQYSVPVWMTEHYRANAFDWANEIHDAIANYNVSAVDHMWGFFGGGQSNCANLIELQHTGTTYTGYVIKKQYYVTGQFSKFVRPGSQRVEAISSNSDVRVTAYTNGGELAIVVLNNHGVAQTVNFTTNGMNAGTLAGVRTSLTENWLALPNAAVSNGMFTTTLPPNSITTFYSEQLPTAIDPLNTPIPVMTLFPNPANDLLSVRLNNIRAGDAHIEISDLNGRVVAKKFVLSLGDGTNVQIPVLHLATGFYSITVNIHGTVLQDKFAITR